MLLNHNSATPAQRKVCVVLWSRWATLMRMQGWVYGRWTQLSAVEPPPETQGWPRQINPNPQQHPWPLTSDRDRRRGQTETQRWTDGQTAAPTESGWGWDCRIERVKVVTSRRNWAHLGYWFSPSVTLGFTSTGLGPQSGTDELVITSTKAPSLIWNSQ